MLNGLYSAAAGMLAQQARMDALSNDIANVNTTGYKPVRQAFRDLVPNPGETGAGAAVLELGRSFSQGPFIDANDPLTIGIDGPGFLQVHRGDGSIALTRSGDLHVDAEGVLVTAAGDRLEPRITLPKGVSPSHVSIGTDGAVTANGAKLGTIVIATVPAPNGLQPVGDNLYAPTAASGNLVAATGSTIRQGVREGSGVDLGSAMVDVIQTQRAYELASRTIHVQDQLMEIANQLRR
jgi:flagellar basal-body rod protein FlgG